MSSFYLIQSGPSSKLETNFNPAIDLGPGEFEIAMHSLETYYSIPNIDAKNNKIRISLDKGKSWQDLTLPIGCYDHIDISNEIQRQVVVIGGDKNDVIIKANKNTFQSVMILALSVVVDFTVENSVRSILGFESKVFKSGRHVSKNTVNSMKINSILLHTDVINSAYLNGRGAPVIYSFWPSMAPGNKIVIEPKVLIYMPLSISLISHMTSWLTGQDQEELDLRGEILTIKYHIRKCHTV